MPVNTGWANSCGKQLFTIGWVECDNYGVPVTGRLNTLQRAQRRARKEDQEILDMLAGILPRLM